MTLRLSKKGLINICLSCIMFIYFLFGILVSFNSLNLSERLDNKLALALVLLLVLWMFLHGRTEKVNVGYHVLFVLLSLCVMVSALLNLSLSLLEYTFCGLFISIVLPKLKLGTVRDTYGKLFFPYLVACIVAVYLYSVSSFNSQGIIYAFCGVCLLNFLCLKKKANLVWYLIIVFGIVVLLRLTRSRTSMLTFLIAAIITYCYLFVRELTLKNLVVLAVVAIGVYVTYEYLMSYFIEIFFNKWGNTDLTSNRTTIWSMIFDRASFWGHGNQYLSGFDAHNTFMQILDMFGVPAFVLMIACIMSVFLKIKQSTYKIVFLNFFSAWTFASMFEDLNFFTSRFLPVTMLFLLHVGLLSNEIRMKRLENNSYCENRVLTR